MFFIKKTKAWFTIVELIVSISIVIILWAIWLFSYNSQLPWVRDANRLSQMEALYNWLKVYGTRNSFWPIPDNKIDINFSGSTFWYQWYAWEDVLREIDFKKWWKDPKDQTYFTYITNKKKKYFQILWFLEKEENLYSFLPEAKASEEISYENRYIKVMWNKLWVLTEDETNTPLQEVESVKNDWYIDLDNSLVNYHANFLDDLKVSGTWNILAQLEDVLVVWWIWCDINWSLITCPQKNIISWEANLVTYNWARRRSDWSYSTSCKQYINPSSPYVYSWDTWDWLYWVNIWWSEIKVYCDMTTDWWWWSLVLKADWNNTTFSYDELYWTNSTTLNESTQYWYGNSWEYKNTLFSNLSFSDINLVIETSLTKENIIINIWDNNLMELFNWAEQNTSFWRATWKSLISDSSLQDNCNREWINVTSDDSTQAKARIWIIANQESNCDTNDSYIGIWLYCQNCSYCSIENTSVWNEAKWPQWWGNNCQADNWTKHIKSFWYIFIR